MVTRPGTELTIDLAGGGHPAPILQHPDGTLEQLAVGGTLLGALDDPQFNRHTLSIERGSTLVLFTDGVTEARSADGAFIGTAAVKAALIPPAQTAKAVADAIERHVLAHCDGTPQDDIAIVVLQHR